MAGLRRERLAAGGEEALAQSRRLAALRCSEALMVTVEIDPVRVESRLAAGELRCSSRPDGVLAGWGFARSRRVVGLADPVLPRRPRCRACAVTHVLLPVSLWLRRAAELIWAVFQARAAGGGHRRIAAAVGIPACTVLGWLRAIGRRAEAVRQWFIGVTVTAGVVTNSFVLTRHAASEHSVCRLRSSSQGVYAGVESPTPRSPT